MKVLFIVNPTAGKGKGKHIEQSIRRFMEKRDCVYEIKFTTKTKEAEILARKGVMQGFEEIVAVGGDGTIYEVANGIIGSGVAMGIIPAGTGNDLARTLEIPENTEDALGIILGGKIKEIDCGKVNDRFFLNVTSIGLDAEIVKETEKIKKYVSGPLSYVLGVYKTLLHFKHKEVVMKLDGKKHKKKIMLVAIANGKYYGGGMKIAPTANIEDGVFEICVINQISKWKLLRLFPTIFSGNHIHVKEVETYKAKKIEISCKENLILNMDGDIVGKTPTMIKMNKKGLRILVPRKA